MQCYKTSKAHTSCGITGAANQPDKTPDMMPIVAPMRLLNAIKYCTKVSKTGAAGKEWNSCASHKPFWRNVTRSHGRRHFLQSFRDILRPDIVNGVISGVIVDRSGTHVAVKFFEAKSSHFRQNAVRRFALI